ncbi:MAG: S1 RNA-binding domain-containing protein [Deltaproteobacteria bacterium]|nr:S1 RNA-binding domain-containing protein [Deltaproteobacteria bacterium]
MSKADGPKGFADMLAEYDGAAPIAKRAPQVGKTVSGQVVAITAETVFVDVGAKTEAVMDRDQLTDDEGQLTVEMGSTVTARVAEASEGSIVLRIRMSRGADPSAELAQAQAHGIPVTGTVAAVNKGGVEVEVMGLRAFCPISQLEARYVEDPAEYIGRKLEFRVTRHESGRGGKANIVLSRRALLEEEAAKRSAELRATLEVEAVMSGKVTRIKDYGVFVDLGGLEGMLHISELGFGHVDHPSEVLSEGQAVQVKILKMEPSDDPKRPDRISLSLKALQDDPWDVAVRELSIGQRLKGKVVRTQPFGAFVTLPMGIEGLVHVSQLVTDRRVAHAKEVVSVGDEVVVSVLEIDTERHRVALSITAAAQDAEAAQAAAYRPASQGSMGTFADLMKQKLKK